MATLYELTDEYTSALKDMESSGFDAETITDSLSVIADEFETKAVNCIKYEKSIDSDIGAIGEEIKRLTAVKKTLSDRKNSLREYIRSNMEATGIDKIECPLFNITLRKAIKVAQIDDESEIESQFKVVIPETSRVDKKALLSALKTGPVPGATLVDGTRGLLIK
ncbi:MAG: siphovirus Gp157 family protein [Gammaproteobacteria bacterium]|nr:siphovirus Gp157 family protein [Gammaproteobacteria bacterium]